MEGSFKALLLDERDVLRGVVTVTEAELTPLHIDLRPHGGDCDRQPGQYRWDRVLKTLEPLPRLQRSREGRPNIEHAIAFDTLDRWDRSRRPADPQSAPPPPLPCEVILSWLDDALQTVDFMVFVDLPLVQEYATARGLLNLKKKV